MWKRVMAIIGVVMIIFGTVVAPLLLKLNNDNSPSSVVTYKNQKVLPVIEKNQQLSLDTLGRINDFNFKALNFALANKKERYVYSPLNHFMANSMLVATNHNQQLLSSLGYDSYNLLEEDINNLVLSSYSMTNPTFISNNALAIVEQAEYNQENTKRIQEKFNAGLFSGDQTYVTSSINDWIIQTTKNNLTFRVDKMNPGVHTVSTTYYNDRWLRDFEEIEDFFYSEDSRKLRFNDGVYPLEYKKTDQVEIGRLNLSNSQVTFIKPEDYNNFDVSKINLELFSDLSSEEMNVRIPKFDFLTDQNFEDLNQKLGILPLVNYDARLICEASRYRQQIGQTRIILDQNGIEAISVIVNDAVMSAPVAKDKEGFVLDKPFYFLLSYQGLITFAGVFY